MGVKTRKLGNISDSLVQWQSVVVADGSTGLTAVSGRGYFINTTSATQTVTLPASPAIGDTISIVDYASTFATNNVTVDPGSNKIEGSTTDATLNTNDQTHTLVFTDSTQGWKIVNQDTASSIQPTYSAATGGTVTTSGDFKIHTFTGDGNFVVSTVGNPVGGGSKVDYLVVAGGGAGGNGSSADNGGGGGAGGYRESHCASVSGPYTASPIATPSSITLTAQTYPIVIGAGGSVTPKQGGAGSVSSGLGITSAGGGGGAANATSPGYCSPANGNGGSGGGGRGGGGVPSVGGNGNTPPVSPPQGNNGGVGGSGSGPNPQSPDGGAGGGGGATAVGSNAQDGPGGAGGAGATTNINASSVTRGGGGGAGAIPGNTVGSGGSGGGGAGGSNSSGAVSGTANTGGGGGGGNPTSPVTSGAGGKGIVIIRYKYQN